MERKEFEREEKERESRRKDISEQLLEGGQKEETRGKQAPPSNRKKNQVIDMPEGAAGKLLG